jgi:FLVCR family MFS transporter 7
VTCSIVKPHNLVGLFVVMTIIGISSITLLPIALELAVEVTRNADGCSAILWASCVFFFLSLYRHVEKDFVIGVICSVSYSPSVSNILRSRNKHKKSLINLSTVEGALRADGNADPPLNMHRALIFHSSFILVASLLIFFIRGEQARKRSDEVMSRGLLEGADGPIQI